MKYKYVAILVVLLLNFGTQSFSYDVGVHQKLNEKATNSSQLDDILITNYDMIQGKLESLPFFEDGREKQHTIQYIISIGGIREDDGFDITLDAQIARTTRGWHHYHDPLVDNWLYAGISDPQYIKYFYRENDVIPMSSIVWAFGLNAQTSDHARYEHTGDWSWWKAREHFYTALTSKSQYAHDKNLGYCFRSLGQLMHLVQDASLPEHTRNEGHPRPFDPNQYEHYVTDMLKNNPSYLNQFAGMIVKPDETVLREPNQPSSPENVQPLSALIDRNIYNGSYIPANSNDLGLAEFTNANFLSDDTIWTYPHPSLYDSSSFTVKTIVKNGINVNRRYLSKIFGEPVEHLVSEGYYYQEEISTGHFERQAIYSLDENCWADYAQLLIPRAIGYSSKILDYFFRGELEITAPSKFLYAIADGGEPVHQFTQIKAKVRNITPDEQTGAGTLVAVAKYKLRPDYRNDLSNDPPTGPPQVDFSYSTSMVLIVDPTKLNSATPDEFTFDFSLDPIPAGVTDLSLFVVFKGTLGLEQESAVAVGSKDLFEPTHLTVTNAYDRVLLDHLIWTIQDIMDNPLLLARVDINPVEHPDGIICQAGEPQICETNISAMLTIYPLDNLYPGSPQVFWELLPSGRHGRFIYLTDDFMANFLIQFDYNGDLNFDGFGYGRVYSTEYSSEGGGWMASGVSVFRRVRQHKAFVAANSYPYVSDDIYFMAPWWDHPLEDLTPVPETQINQGGVVLP
jgi:hypothetical protein